eukprot:3748416-Pyramimonas_sp.AAC.1
MEVHPGRRERLVSSGLGPPGLSPRGLLPLVAAAGTASIPWAPGLTFTSPPPRLSPTGPGLSSLGLL